MTSTAAIYLDAVQYSTVEQVALWQEGFSPRLHEVQRRVGHLLVVQPHPLRGLPSQVAQVAEELAVVEQHRVELLTAIVHQGPHQIQSQHHDLGILVRQLTPQQEDHFIQTTCERGGNNHQVIKNLHVHDYCVHIHFSALDGVDHVRALDIAVPIRPH